MYFNNNCTLFMLEDSFLNDRYGILFTVKLIRPFLKRAHPLQMHIKNSVGLHVKTFEITKRSMKGFILT